MKVLVVARHPVGGIRTWMRQVYSKPEFREFEICILGSECDDLHGLRADLKESGVEVVGVTGEARGLLRETARRLLTNQWDMVHTHGFTAAGIVALVSLGSRVKHVTTFHDVILDGQLMGLKGWLRKQALRATFLRADYIQCVGQSANDNVIEMLELPPSVCRKMRVIRNGIDVKEVCEASAPDLHTRYGVGEEVFLIGFFGRFMSQKGFRYLVDAIDILSKEGSPKQPLVVAFGSGNFRARVLRDISARDLERFFKIEDSVPRVGGWMRQVDVVAMPSLWEACPLVAMEAMVVGAPLLCSDLAPFRELTSESPAILVEPSNARAVATAIVELMHHPRRKMALAFAEQARETFNVVVTAHGVAKLYREVQSR